MCWINLSTHRIHKWMQKIQTSFPRQLWRNIFLKVSHSYRPNTYINVIVCIGTLRRYLKYIDKTHLKKIQRHDQCSSLWVMVHLIWLFCTKNANFAILTFVDSIFCINIVSKHAQLIIRLRRLGGQQINYLSIKMRFSKLYINFYLVKKNSI